MSIHKIQSYFFSPATRMLSLTGALLLLFQGPLRGQVDEQRMDRDVRIMQKALNEVLRDEFDRNSPVIWGADKGSKARYIPNVGIMLYARESVNYPELEEWDEKEGGKSEKQLELEGALKNFLADYGDLARELPEDEHIMIQVGSGKSNNSFFYVDSGKSKGQNTAISVSGYGSFKETLLAKVSKSTVNKLRKGAISRDDFDNAVEMDWTQDEAGENKEFKVFAQILKSLYEQESGSSTFAYVYSDDEEVADAPCDDCEEEWFPYENFGFKSSWGNKVEYDRVKGLGAEFHLKLGYYLKGYQFSFSYSFQNDEEQKAELEEGDREYLLQRDEKIEEIYEDFIPELQEAMVLYGRTLRSLEEDEYVIVHAEMPACYECDLPAKLEFKILRATLTAFDEGNMQLEEAMDAIEVSKSGKAKDLKDLPTMIIMGDDNSRVIQGRGRLAPRVEIRRGAREIRHKN